MNFRREHDFNLSDFYNTKGPCPPNFVIKKDIMKKMMLSLSLMMLFFNANTQINSTNKNQVNMKLNAGILTEKIQETKAFYKDVLNFGVTFENEFYLLLHTPNHQAELSFLLPNHPTQQPFFHKPFTGQGLYLTIEVDDVDSLYEKIKEKGITIEVEIRDEPWGDRHFAIQDPNGIGIDIVKYSAPAEN